MEREQAVCASPWPLLLCTIQKVTIKVLQQETVMIFYKAQILLPLSPIIQHIFALAEADCLILSLHFDAASKRHALGLYL